MFIKVYGAVGYIPWTFPLDFEWPRDPKCF